MSTPRRTTWLISFLVAADENGAEILHQKTTPGGCALGQGPMSPVPDAAGRHGLIVAGWHRGVQAVSGLLHCSRGHARKQVEPKRGLTPENPGACPLVVRIGFDGVSLNHHAYAGHGVPDGPCVLDGPFLADFRACFGPLSTTVWRTCRTDHFEGSAWFCGGRQITSRSSR